MTPADILAENEAQEFRQLTRVIDAITTVLPDAHVRVWLEHRAQRSPSTGTCHVIQYAGEINDALPVRGPTLDEVRNKLFALAGEIKAQRRPDQASGLREMAERKRAAEEDRQNEIEMWRGRGRPVNVL
jgi:hypothetical protein